MFLRKNLLALALASSTAFATGVVAQDAATEAEMITDVSSETVVATVNDTDITMGAVIAARRTLPQEVLSMDPAQLFDAIVTRLVQQEALKQEVDEISDALKYQLENDRRAVLAGAALIKAVEESVTEEDVQAAYDTQFADFEPNEEFRAAHILVETEEAAQELVSELNDGADFADLARQHSTGPTGPNGGDLGWFSEGMMVAPFEEAVLALEEGEVSQPVQTQFGWHVIKLIETRMQEAPSLEEVRGQIEESLQNAASQKVVEDIAGTAEVVVAEGISPEAMFDDSLLAD